MRVCVCVSVHLPSNPCGRLGQVHVQCSQQQVDEVDPQIYAQRDYLQTLNTHLTKTHHSHEQQLIKTCKKRCLIVLSCKLSLLFYLLCFVVVSSAALQISEFLPVAVAERVASEEGL